MNTRALQVWLEVRAVVCSIRVHSGIVSCNIFPPGQSGVTAESNELDEAVRLALLAFDLAASSDDLNDLLDPNSFPCPECQRVVTSVRAARTETGWVIESAYGVGSLQACCVAKDLIFETEQEAREFAALCERGARER